MRVVSEGTLRVVRAPAAWRDRLRRYQILVDGVPLGSVADGETTELSLPAGRHRIRMEIAWTGSKELEVDVAAGATTSVYCSARAATTTLLDLLSRTRWVEISSQPLDR